MSNYTDQVRLVERLRWFAMAYGRPICTAVQKEGIMCDEKTPKPGMLVEDTSVVGGVDKKTGQPVIRTKAPDGKADKLTEATDKRENSNG